MRKMTLDTTWKRCMAMWRWIGKEIRKGSTLTVGELKAEWLRRYGHGAQPRGDCYFCKYAAQQSDRAHDDTKGICTYCPGALVSKRFSCCRKSYDYVHRPLAFLAKLESLYEIYKKQKKGRKSHAE